MRLIPVTPELLDAAVESDEALARELGADVAPGWDGGMPEAVRYTRDAVAADPESVRWGTRFFLHGDPPVMVGWGGFKGPPKRGTVELGYSIAPELRNQGLATAATRELIAEAYEAGEVRSVIAHTLPEQNASTRVLEKSGFVHDGEATEDGQAVWRWRLRRV